MKVLRIFLAFIFIAFFFQNCKSEEPVSYWKMYSWEAVNNQPVEGIKLVFVEMIFDTEMHLVKNGEEISIDYPYRKKMKISDFKSFSDVKDEGEFLDEIYSIKIEDDSLRIGVGFGKKTDYIYTFAPMSKAEYENEVKKLNTELEEVRNQLKPVDYSTFDLNIPRPAYFNSVLRTGQTKPYASAFTSFAGKTSFEITSADMDFEKNNKEYSYNWSFVDDTQDLNFAAAKIGEFSFSNLDYFVNNETKKIEAVVMDQDTKNFTDINNLLSYMNKTLGTPSFDPETEDIFLVQWHHGNQIIKLGVLQYLGTNKEGHNITRLVDKNLAPNNALKDFLVPGKESNVTVTIVTKNLAELNKGDFLSGPLEIPYNR